MIRSNVVRLTCMQAVAYRQKLPSGGSGIVILKKDVSQPGIASISKTSGEAILAANTSANEYPQEAFAEAIALTNGMPYRKLGGVKYVDETVAEIEDEVVEVTPEEVIVDGDEYQAIIVAYTNKNDKFSYDLLNKDLIKLANSNKQVQALVADGNNEDDICVCLAGIRFRDLTGNAELSDEQVKIIIAMLDEIYDKGVFKELKSEIRGMLSSSKRQ